MLRQVLVQPARGSGRQADCKEEIADNLYDEQCCDCCHLFFSGRLAILKDIVKDTSRSGQ
jgi:hypothetical protein